jgi:GTP:adenosylcobinamide-phosphate guanylyltransferase
MEVLRLPTTTVIEVEIELPESDTEYLMKYSDILTNQSFSASATTGTNKRATFQIDNYYLSYTGDLEVQIYSPSNLLVYSGGIEVVRPYCDINVVKNKLNITTAEIEQYEKIVRKIIESEASTFTFVKKQKEVIGMGMDYLPIDEKIQSLTRVYENNRLIYDIDTPDDYERAFKISIDKSSIVQDHEATNRLQYTKVWNERALGVDFPTGYDYIVEGEFGYKIIPSDVQEACELLIQDVAENNLRYVNRYIEKFDNTEFNITFNKNYGSGTGNLIVDKILAKYKNRIRLGVM